MQQGVFIDFDDAVTDFDGEELADDGGLVGKGFDEDVEEEHLREEGRDVVANEGDEG